MRPLEEIRVDIDSIDKQIRELLMRRLDLSEQVVSAKIQAKNYVIYRADREEAMLERLSEGIAEDRKAGYLAVVKKVIETSRMHQYEILYEQAGELYVNLVKDVEVPDHSSHVTVKLTRPDIPNSMSAILSMIGDYGYNMEEMDLLSYSEDGQEVSFALKILGDIAEISMQKMLLQLSMESKDFSIVKFV